MIQTKKVWIYGTLQPNSTTCTTLVKKLCFSIQGRGNTMVEETYMGVCKTLAQSCLHSTDDVHMPKAFMDKYLWALHFMYVYGEKFHPAWGEVAQSSTFFMLMVWICTQGWCAFCCSAQCWRFWISTHLWFTSWSAHCILAMLFVAFHICDVTPLWFTSDMNQNTTMHMQQT